MKVKVKCTWTVEVEVPDDPEYDARFDLVENHCPGTGLVGAALDKAMREARAASVCWACNGDGKCEIVAGLPAEPSP